MLTLIRFIKNWTLPISMGIGALVYLIFYYVPALDTLSQKLAPTFDTILPLFMFLILYVTFCKVNFKKLLPVRWHFWASLFQIVLVAAIVGVILYFRVGGKELILLESILACVIAPCASATVGNDCAKSVR